MRFSIRRANEFLLFFILLVVVLVFGAQILKPVFLACMLAMLMAPLCRWFDRKGFSRLFSSLICVFLLLLFILGILSVITTQIVIFANDIPLIEKKGQVLVNNIQEFVEQKFSISPVQQSEFVKKQITKLSQSAGRYATTIINGITSTIATVILMLVLTFLLLFNKEKYENFFVKLYGEEDEEKVREEIEQITKVSQYYLSGRAISMGIQAVVYSIGLSVIGIKNGILLGCLAALLTILPYIGTILGGLFPVLMSLITESSMNTTLWVILLLVVIQVIDNYFIEPNVVGGKVHLNALFTILIILSGGLLWGVAGMILFTPMLGVARIIFEHREELKPYAYLIGDEEKSENKSSLSNKIKNKLRFKK